jgi:hypothetical protein
VHCDLDIEYGRSAEIRDPVLVDKAATSWNDRQVATIGVIAQPVILKRDRSGVAIGYDQFQQFSVRRKLKLLAQALKFDGAIQ